MKNAVKDLVRRDRRADVLLWLALAAPVVAVGRMGLGEPRDAVRLSAGLVVLAVACAVRRARPAVAFLLAAALGLVTAPSLFSLSYGAALAAFALLLGRRAEGARPVLPVFAAVAAAGTAKIVVRDVDPVVEWLVLMGTLLFGAVFPWLGGRYWRQGRALTAAALARADQLEREQRIVADRARLRERARIAQDMHDVLGHELSLIAVRAGALQVAADVPERHRAALADLRAAASDATDRLREIIGVLRDEGDETAPLGPPGESVAALVARAAESGLRVRHVTRSGGTAPGAPLTPTAERTVHRVVQEALTNAAKYAPAAEVEVTVATPAGPDAAGEVTVTVVNGAGPAAGAEPGVEPGAAGAPGGPGAAGASTGGASAAGPVAVEPVAVETGDCARGGAPGAFAPDGAGAATAHAVVAPPGGGSGLRGLAERVAGVGGTFEAGARADGGFRVVARLPVTAGSTAPGEGAAVGAEHSRARRRTALALGAAVAAAVLLVGGAFAWYAYSRTHTVLDPADYAKLRAGQPAAAAEKVLPGMSASDPPTDRAPTPPPPGADCRYYRASGQLFVSVDYFRLCFAEDGDGTRRLVAKDRIPKVGPGRGGGGERE